MDKARRQTDKKLKVLEKQVGRIYSTDPALKQIEKEYAKYMKMVEKKTKSAYDAYINETDQDVKRELKKKYGDEVKALTLDSAEYKKLIKKFVSIMSKVNQKALDIVNKNMPEIYAINYNQAAVMCRELGIKVNG